MLYEIRDCYDNCYEKSNRYFGLFLISWLFWYVYVWRWSIGE